MKRIRRTTFWLLVMLQGTSSCRTPAGPEEYSSLSSDQRSDELINASNEFKDLQLSLEVGYVGTMKRSSPVDAFLGKTDIAALEKEMKAAFLGTSNTLNFVYCEQRGFFPKTTLKKECDYVVGGENTTFEFNFLAINPQTGKGCLLTSETCKIHQVITVLAKNNGIQRPPVFVFKKPVDELMMIFTYNVIHSNNVGIGNFLRRWTESGQFAAFVTTPYGFSRPYGKELAKVLGYCNKMLMNLVHFSNFALERHRQRKMPVALSGVAANSIMLTGMVMIGANSLLKLKGGMAVFKKGVTLRGLNKKQIAVSGLDFIDDVSAIPYVFTELANWRDHIKKYPKNSPQYRAIQTAIFLANIGDIAGLTHLGIIAKRHLKTTTKVLGTVAGVGVGSYALGITPIGQGITNGIRNGNIDQVRYELCQLQKSAGLRKHCVESSYENASTCN